MAHFSIDLRAEFRAGVVDGWLERSSRRADPEPLHPLQRQRAARRDARPRASASARATLATGHYARVERSGAEPLLMTATDAGQGPELCAVGPGAGIACAAALPARRAAQAGGPRARPRRPACRSPPSATRRTSASSPAPAARRSSSATAACAAVPGRCARAAASCSASTTARTSTRSASAAASASRPRAPCTCSATDAQTNTVTVGPRSGAAGRPRSRCGRSSCTVPPRRSTACACAPTAAAWTAPARPPRRGPPPAGGDRAARAGRAHRARPARLPVRRRSRRRPRHDRLAATGGGA